MRVTHIITRLILGGAQENTLATVLGLQAKPDVEVHLIAGPSLGPEGSLEERAAAIPGLFFRLPALVRPIHPMKDLLATLRLRQILARQRPHIVHTHSGKAGILGRLAARWARVPVCVHSIHGPSFGDFQGGMVNCLFRSIERLAGRWTTHFVTVADAMTRRYLEAGIGTPAQYTRIFSGFDLPPFLEAEYNPDLRERLGFQADHCVVGTIARLFKLKGHDDLLDVMPELVAEAPRLRFLWVGDGAWRRRLEERVRAAGMQEFVRFVGLVPPGEIPAYIGAMDALVHLSRREGLPRALPQALASGKPVVAYDCDGAAEVCFDGKTGWLVSPGNNRQLIERLVQLAGNPELRRRLGKAGRQFVRRHFSESELVERQYRLYRRLMAETHTPPE